MLTNNYSDCKFFELYYERVVYWSLLGSLLGVLDPSIHTKAITMNASWIVSLWMCRDEEVQVNGIIYLMDLTGFNMKHQAFWNLEDMKIMMNLYQVHALRLVQSVHNLKRQWWKPGKSNG